MTQEEKANTKKMYKSYIYNIPEEILLIDLVKVTAYCLSHI